MTDLIARYHDAPVDPELTAAVRARGLDVRREDDTDPAQVAGWLQAVFRGFLDAEPTELQRETSFARGGYRRKVGVHDPQSPDPEVPVATFASWVADLTLPGGAVLPACAISAVTVAPTHRRRGLLRGLMGGELRTAAALGVPIAALTVSESGIYGRFGFGPAAPATTWRIDVRRAGWIGPTAPGRVDFVSRARARELVAELHERVRRGSAGEIRLSDDHADRKTRTRPDAEKAGELRAVQYRSPAGGIDGVVVYSTQENHDDFAASTLRVAALIAATDDAYAGLWHFLLSMDLIGTIHASELSVDEPLWWMIADQRAARITLRDHHYLRVLDVAAVLTARRYDRVDRIVLDLEDPLGLTAGRYLLETDADGRGAVTAGAGTDGDLTVRLGVAELSAILLGGVSAATLARAGRVHTDDPARLARLFAWPTAPRLSYWY